jgi:hypothetical protein
MVGARSVLVFSAIVALAGCWRPTAPDAVAGKPFDLKVGAIVKLPGGPLFKFDGVNADSRCPLDAQCVRAGEAILSVSLITNGSLEIREMRTDSTGSRITYANHAIRITALAPYPRASQQINPQDYVATFVVQDP